MGSLSPENSLELLELDDSSSDKDVCDWVGSEEEESEEDFDDDESDGLNTQAFLDHLDMKFDEILNQKVADTERIYDQGLILSVSGKGLNVGIQTDFQIDQLTHKLGSGQPKNSVLPGKNVEIQTDDASMSGLLVSMQTKTEPDVARAEIANLREDRMSLVSQRKKLDERIKSASPTECMRDEQIQLYKLEETIEAIDTVIEYKNEIICGQTFVLSSTSSLPGQVYDEAELVSRLTNLSVLEQQRLMCKYFSKVVELRYSSRQLEKALEKLEDDMEKIRRRMSMDRKFMEKREEENETRIRSLLSQKDKDPISRQNSFYKILEKDLVKSQKKQYDLERSLTELLIRHGYLINGHDYEVKQVVKMLGIDTVQMGLNWRDDDREDRRKRHKPSSSRGLIPPEIASRLEFEASSQGMSRRMKESMSKRRNAQITSHVPMHMEQISTRNGHHHQPHNSSHGPTEHRRHHSHHNTHNHSSRHAQQPPPEPFPGTEVHRQKKKLIIQPPHAS